MKIKLLWQKIFVFLFIVCVPAVLCAQKDKEVILGADKLEYNQKDNLIRLIGNVSIKFKDITIKGKKADFDTVTQKGKITGNVIIEQPGSKLTAEKSEIFYTEERAVLSGGVRLVTERSVIKEQASNAISTLSAEKIEYFWNASKGKAEGSVLVISGGRKIRGDKAYFDGAKGMIQITGNVKVEQENGDWIEADRALVNLKKKDVLAEGKVRGTFIFTESKGSVSPAGTRSDYVSPADFPPMEFTDFSEGSIPPAPGSK